MYFKIFLSIITIFLNLGFADNIKSTLHITNTDKNKISLIVNSNNFSLSSDALQDNLGGYVDIPKESFFPKNR